jgi:hypothetical protein
VRITIDDRSFYRRTGSQGQISAPPRWEWYWTWPICGPIPSPVRSASIAIRVPGYAPYEGVIEPWQSDRPVRQGDAPVRDGYLLLGDMRLKIRDKIPATAGS